MQPKPIDDSAPARTIDMNLYRRRIARRRREVRDQSAFVSACIGVAAMAAIYLVTLLAVAQMRASTHPQQAVISAAPAFFADHAKF